MSYIYLDLMTFSISVVTREAACDSSLGGVPVEAGTAVVLDALSIHRDRRVWGEDADEFRPDR